MRSARSISRLRAVRLRSTPPTDLVGNSRDIFCHVSLRDGRRIITDSLYIGVVAKRRSRTITAICSHMRNHSPCTRRWSNLRCRAASFSRYLDRTAYTFSGCADPVCSSLMRLAIEALCPIFTCSPDATQYLHSLLKVFRRQRLGQAVTDSRCIKNAKRVHFRSFQVIEEVCHRIAEVPHHLRRRRDDARPAGALIPPVPRALSRHPKAGLPGDLAHGS